MSLPTLNSTLNLTKVTSGLAAGSLLFLSVTLAGPANSQASQATVQDTIEVTVDDKADQIAPEDEAFLETDTLKIDFPEEVTAVRYLTLSGGSNNINDDVEEILRAEHPDWIQEDSFAPGIVIIAVGFDPNTMGAYAGNDVAAATGIAEQDRIDGITDSMRPLLQDGRTALAMLEGAQSVADTSVVAKSNEASGWWLAGILGGIAALIAVGVGWAVGHERKKKAQTARENFNYAQRHYGEVAQQLDGINVRAHSLTSPLANDELRRQWEDVNSRFLEVNDIFGELDGLTAASDNKAFHKSSDKILKAYLAVTQMETAQKNIDTLYDMEHGNEDVRRRELTRLREDMQEARQDINDKDTVVDDILRTLIQRTEDLAPNSPSFMDDYSRIIRDYGVALRGVEKQLDEVKQTTDRTTPAIYDDNWRVGTGYNAFVPYYMISTWHAADVSAASAASSSSGSANTSFSSGFSGAGGGSSW
ncbi:hypothetical protein CDES_12970 [Corynebacterium deserti GIMN1.010]|uniref:DUF5129 domain-containing protein n=1 Tax=Corynebacterium deserti GIMN1.010 TaxID=931089 RepID=A0A0M4CLD5_9CORY|nr:DUF5129 domain-containing protein [Corynebacterium deserti]ALC06938.1 hypothetical protein CDES_12970 [Corynebacterium deserti GIMN1.010]